MNSRFKETKARNEETKARLRTKARLKMDFYVKTPYKCKIKTKKREEKMFRSFSEVNQWLGCGRTVTHHEVSLTVVSENEHWSYY